jgi:hypothetical protein
MLSPVQILSTHHQKVLVMALTIFLSHSIQDDAIVADLRTALEAHGVSVWADSQRLSAGEALTPRIQQAIAEAQHFVVLLSPRAINSHWVHKEVQHAQAVQRTRYDGFKIIPVVYDGVTPGALSWLFGEEVLAVELGTGPDAIVVALDVLLPALGLQQPDEPRRVPPLDTAPFADLTLHLTEPGIVEQDGTRRATAIAELTYQPPDGAPPIHSRPYRVTASLGPLEADDLTWYLEDTPCGRARPFSPTLARWKRATALGPGVLYSLERLGWAASAARRLAGHAGLPGPQPAAFVRPGRRHPDRGRE